MAIEKGGEKTIFIRHSRKTLSLIYLKTVISVCVFILQRIGLRD